MRWASATVVQHTNAVPPSSTTGRNTSRSASRRPPARTAAPGASPASHTTWWTLTSSVRGRSLPTARGATTSPVATSVNNHPG